MAPLVALSTGGVDVRLDLGFEGAGEHPPRSLSSDLVEIEHEPFADFIVLILPTHWRRYTTLFKECSIHNF
jgi:hypothetical protein